MDRRRVKRLEMKAPAGQCFHIFYVDTDGTVTNDEGQVFIDQEDAEAFAKKQTPAGMINNTITIVFFDAEEKDI